MSHHPSLHALLLAGLVTSACDRPPAPAAPTREDAPWIVSEGPDLPVPLTNNAVASAVIDGRAHVFSFLGLGPGRDHRAITTAAYALDVAAGRWDRLPDVPGPAGRLAATAQALGDKVYVFGGYAVAADGAETTSPAVDIFDLRSRRYSRGAETPVPIDDTVSGVWRQRLVYLVSGWSTDRNVADVQIYDPAANAWRAATPIPGTPVFGHAGAIVDDTIVYCGGARMQPGQTPKYGLSAECYRGDIDPADPATIAWQAIAPHPGAARYRAAAGAVQAGATSGVLFVGGTANPYNYNGVGYDGQPSEPEASTWLYDVTGRAWIPGPLVPAASMDHRGLVSADDRWWIVGGMGTGQMVSPAVTVLRPER